VFNSKQKVVELVARQFRKRINYLHIAAIINLLLKELSEELLAGKELKIGNFGTFLLKTLGSKRNIDVVSGKERYTKKTRILRFKISDMLLKLLKGEIK
jgi:nucleoid DNA-binding protein